MHCEKEMFFGKGLGSLLGDRCYGDGAAVFPAGFGDRF